MVEAPDVGDADIGKPAQRFVAPPSADGVQISNTGRSSSRMESKSLPSAQENPWGARRGPDAKTTVKLRSPARKADSEMPSTVSGAWVTPATVHAERSLITNQSR